MLKRAYTREWRVWWYWCGYKVLLALFPLYKFSVYFIETTNRVKRLQFMCSWTVAIMPVPLWIRFWFCKLSYSGARLFLAILSNNNYTVSTMKNHLKCKRWKLQWMIYLNAPQNICNPFWWFTFSFIVFHHFILSGLSSGHSILANVYGAWS